MQGEEGVFICFLKRSILDHPGGHYHDGFSRIVGPVPQEKLGATLEGLARSCDSNTHVMVIPATLHILNPR